MKKLILCLFGTFSLLSMTQCKKSTSNVQAMVNAVNAADAAFFDQTKPTSVVQRLFDAAKADDPSLLFGLCDPEKRNDGDTDCICALDAKYVPHQCTQDSHNRLNWEEYKEAFVDGKVVGEPTLEAGNAVVNFNFGPGGTENESMSLVQRGEKWYLTSF